jgi:hypothetical protein
MFQMIFSLFTKVGFLYPYSNPSGCRLSTEETLANLQLELAGITLYFGDVALLGD